MTFFSILYENVQEDINEEKIHEPDCFEDLNLDQVVLAITTGFEEYNLKPFFYDPLQSLNSITYRHEILRDLENPHVYESIRSFSEKMRQMRKDLTQANKLYYQYQKESWFLDAVDLYCRSVQEFAQDLSDLNIHSRGLSSFLQYLTQYIASLSFTNLCNEIDLLKTELSQVRYCVLLKGKEVTVRRYQDEEDFHYEVGRRCEKFTSDVKKYYHEHFSDYPDMNHVKAKILELVAKLFPEVFSHLDLFYEKNADFPDEIITRFDREIQFYIAYLEFISPLQKNGLSFCIPHITIEKEISDIGGFDLALAHTLIHEGKSIVCNDFYLKDGERIFVITGPNQGGKTTFARTFGQLHYLASLGLKVPGTSARLFLFDKLFTHFEREEDIENMRSKLEDDLVRIHAIFEQSTSRSIIIINEMFTSTTVQDALFLGKKVLGKASDLDLLCIYVTFLDELTHLNKTVSLVSTVHPADPDVRTYKIERRPADGLSYAVAIAKKNHVTYDDIMERIVS